MLDRTMSTESLVTSRWILHGHKGIDCLQLGKDNTLPSLEDTEVLVHIHAASLNHRDLAIAQGVFSVDTREDIVPSSDGGEYSVTIFKIAISNALTSWYCGRCWSESHLLPHWRQGRDPYDPSPTC